MKKILVIGSNCPKIHFMYSSSHNRRQVKEFNCVEDKVRSDRCNEEIANAYCAFIESKVSSFYI